MLYVFLYIVSKFLCVTFFTLIAAKNQAPIFAFLACFLFLILIKNAIWHNSDTATIPWIAWGTTLSVLVFRGSKSVPGWLGFYFDWDFLKKPTKNDLSENDLFLIQFMVLR